jgi:hypothetical protein
VNGGRPLVRREIDGSAVPMQMIGLVFSLSAKYALARTEIHIGKPRKQNERLFDFEVILVIKQIASLFQAHPF